MRTRPLKVSCGQRTWGIFQGRLFCGQQSVPRLSGPRCSRSPSRILLQKDRFWRLSENNKLFWRFEWKCETECISPYNYLLLQNYLISIWNSIREFFSPFRTFLSIWRDCKKCSNQKIDCMRIRTRSRSRVSLHSESTRSAALQNGFSLSGRTARKL